MDANELRALADALEPMAKAPRFDGFDVPEFCAWLRACADAKPVGYFGKSAMDSDVWIEMESWATNAIPLYTHPAPAAPQAERAGWKWVPVEPTPEMLASTSWPGCAGTDYAHMLAAAPAAPQAEPKREPLSDERIAEIQRAAYERAAQECIETAAELRRCADGCTDGRYDWKADGADDCADAIRALGRQHD